MLNICMFEGGQQCCGHLVRTFLCLNFLKAKVARCSMHAVPLLVILKCQIIVAFIITLMTWCACWKDAIDFPLDILWKSASSGISANVFIGC